MLVSEKFPLDFKGSRIISPVLFTEPGIDSSLSIHFLSALTVLQHRVGLHRFIPFTYLKLKDGVCPH